MINSPSGSASNADVATGPGLSADSKHVILEAIGARWGKFSEHDPSSLKNADDLVTRLIAKCGLEKSVARRRPDEGPSYLNRV